MDVGIHHELDGLGGSRPARETVRARVKTERSVDTRRVFMVTSTVREMEIVERRKGTLGGLQRLRARLGRRQAALPGRVPGIAMGPKCSTFRPHKFDVQRGT